MLLCDVFFSYLDLLCSSLFHAICCRMSFVAAVVIRNLFRTWTTTMTKKNKTFWHENEQTNKKKRQKFHIKHTPFILRILFSHSVEFVYCVSRNTMCCASANIIKKNWQKNESLCAQLRESHNISKYSTNAKALYHYGYLPLLPFFPCAVQGMKIAICARHTAWSNFQFWCISTGKRVLRLRNG